jgi:alkylation response protein AidB-like acyl-CoA dehydrogenase
MAESPLTHLNEEDRMFYDALLSYAREQIGPHVSEMDASKSMRREILDELFELGVMGIEIPEAFGGTGGTFFQSILAVEAMAVVDPSVSVLVDVQNTLVINALMRWGTDDIRSRYFPKLASEWIGAYCLSEPSAGSDAFALRTRAEKRGETWVLNGEKLWITNADEANLFLVFATIDPSLGAKGITAFLVERDTPGFEIGKKEDKLGIRASSTCSLGFHECVIPEANMLGDMGMGYKIAILTLNEGRIGIGAQMIGLAQGAFDNAMRYILEREQFGKRIVDFQGIQFQFARVATEIEAARLLVYNCARHKAAWDAELKKRGCERDGELHFPEGSDFKYKAPPWVKEAAMAKLFSSEVAERTASICLEFFGGVGYTKEFPAEKYYRDSKIGKIYEGTSNMQLNTIAKEVIKTYERRS